ncbi:hypothetical protein [Brachyspira hyodysenteriae]|uniref:hypothetical protein n=1 Tax=Brachyspira hyodysenteriae TaxID=159 RepID=UPI0022CD367D|nr:hypothetical protein [Brachyspira hyodysenteriae]MCZ9992251.1 hypothetical protein [Brachyspira hyodysenteriae]
MNNKKNINDIIIDFIEKNYNKIFIITVILLSLIIRLYFVPWRSSDYYNDLKDWFIHFQENGFSGFKNIYDISNYPSLYMIIMALTSLLPQFSIEQYPDLSIIFYIKLPSIINDFFTAFIVSKIIKEYTNKDYLSYISFVCVLFSPLVLFNGALIGQIDGLYSSFAVFSLYFFYKKDYIKAFLMFGVSIAIKTNAIFIFPLIILLYIKERFHFKYFFLTFIPHIVATLIATMFGANFIKALTILGGQRYQNLSNGAPSLPDLIFRETSFEQFYKWMFMTFFIILAIILCAIFLYIFIKQKNKLNLDTFILWALVISFSIPFILPSMHERFYYISEILALIYAFMKPKYAYITILLYFATFSRYIYSSYLPEFTASVLMLTVFILLMRTLIKENEFE